jgi:hypothetical protein
MNCCQASLKRQCLNISSTHSHRLICCRRQSFLLLTLQLSAKKKVALPFITALWVPRCVVSVRRLPEHPGKSNLWRSPTALLQYRTAIDSQLDKRLKENGCLYTLCQLRRVHFGAGESFSLIFLIRKTKNFSSKTSWKSYPFSFETNQLPKSYFDCKHKLIEDYF